MTASVPVNTDLNVDFCSFLEIFALGFLVGDIILLHEIQTMQLFDGEQVDKILSGKGCTLLSSFLR